MADEARPRLQFIAINKQHKKHLGRSGLNFIVDALGRYVLKKEGME
jgi:hypothetical protein